MLRLRHLRRIELRSERALEILEHHQNRISATITKGRQTLAGDDHAGLRDALVSHRWELVRLLREYQLFKHNEIFDPVMRGENEARVRAASELKERCIAIADRFTAYVKEWSLSSDPSGWTSYRTDALRMANDIERHLLREAQGVKALLAGVERTRQS